MGWLLGYKMEFKDIIDELSSLKNDYPWYDQKGEGEIYVISSDGLHERLYQYTSLTIGPFVISERDHKGLSENRSTYQPQDYENEPNETLEMFDSGCKPGIEYFRWGEPDPDDDPYYEWDEIFNFIAENLLHYQEPLPWNEIVDEELVEWYNVLKYAKKGYRSWVEVQANERKRDV